MKGYPQIYCLFLALFIFGVLSASGNRVFAQNPAAEWTLMFYMDSDNNLEAPQMKDLDEMMAVGSTTGVNIVLLVDRSAKSDVRDGYTDRAVGGLKNWTTAKMLYVEKGRLRELADWGEVNMGDPATLKKFLQTAVDQFPAKHYALTFGDHGAGWVGIVADESADNDSLDTVELPSVLQSITAKTGKLDLIGFDACMMANFETAKALAPFGKTMVASEELEPGDGWNYTPLLGALTRNPGMDGVTLGKTIIDTFRDYYLPKEGDADPTVTLSVIDLEKIPAIETAVNNLSVTNRNFMKAGGSTNWKKTARARSKTEEFGVHQGTHYNYYDLINYAENLKREQPDAATVASADAVTSAVRAAIIYKTNGSAHPRSTGLTIYFPPDKENLTGFGYSETPFSQTGKWMPFLADYTGTQGLDTQAPQIQNVATTDKNVAKDDVITVTAQVKADDIEEATFVLAESHADGEIIIGAIPAEPDEKGLLKEEWDGSWFSIGDGTKELICPITNFEEIEEGTDVYLAEVPAQVRYKGTSQWRNVTLYFQLDFNTDEDVTGEFIYAFEFKNNRAREVSIEAGDSIRPVYIAIDKNGESSMIASDDKADILTVSKDDDLTVGRMDVAPGKYLIGFTVTDFSDNTTEEFTEVTIQ